MKHFLFVCLMLTFIVTNGQVTTGSISGTVKNSKGERLSGASVKLKHEPTGVQYSTIAQEDGKYTIPNLRVGGPYTLSVSIVSYNNYKNEELNVTVGQTLQVNVEMELAETTLKEVVITSDKNTLFKSNRTGLATTISSTQLTSLPIFSISAVSFVPFLTAAL